MFENLFSNLDILYQAGSSVAALVAAVILIKFVIRIIKNAGAVDYPSNNESYEEYKRDQEWWAQEGQRQWDIYNRK